MTQLFWRENCKSKSGAIWVPWLSLSIYVCCVVCWLEAGDRVNCARFIPSTRDLFKLSFQICRLEIRKTHTKRTSCSQSLCVYAFQIKIIKLKGIFYCSWLKEKVDIVQAFELRVCVCCRYRGKVLRTILLVCVCMKLFNYQYYFKNKTNFSIQTHTHF